MRTSFYEKCNQNVVKFLEFEQFSLRGISDEIGILVKLLTTEPVVSEYSIALWRRDLPNVLLPEYASSSL